MATEACSHLVLELWMPANEYHCSDCKVQVRDVGRIAAEGAWLERIEGEDRQMLSIGGVGQHAPLKGRAAVLAHERGVTIDWLVQWTTKHDLWALPTWQVKRSMVVPRTSKTRCRFVDLPQMRDVRGPAQTFVSHCWGASWGSLVSAVADHADPSRRVWIDIFAVRQWPGNQCDLDFKGVISKCSSFVLVCASLPSVSNMDKFAALRRDLHLIPDTDKKKLAFFRVWCLVEIAHARQCSLEGPKSMAIVMKCGERCLGLEAADAYHAFKPDSKMLWKLGGLVDVAHAEATVEADRERIMADIARDGGCDIINRMVRATCWAAGHAVAPHPSVAVL